MPEQTQAKPRPKIKRKDIRIPEQLPRKFYHCGVTDDCPIQTVHAGGIDFPLFVQKQVPREGDERRTILGEERYAGRIHELTDAQVEKCVEMISKKVVRSRRVISMEGSRNKPYVPMPDDEPLAKYVYLVPVDSPTTVDRSMPPKAETLLED